MVSEKVAKECLVKLRSSHVDPFAVNELELRARLLVLHDVVLHVCSLVVGHMQIYDRDREKVYGSVDQTTSKKLTLDMYIRDT